MKLIDLSKDNSLGRAAAESILIMFGVLAAILASGCAATARQDFHEELSVWEGKSINEFLAISKSPNEVLSISDYTLYRWNNSESGVITTAPQTNCTTTPGLPGEFGTPPVTTCNTYGGSSTPYTESCSFAFRVRHEIISAVEVTGNGCYWSGLRNFKLK